MLLPSAAYAAQLPDLKAAAEQLRPWLVSVRREFHQHPELMYEEHETSARIRKYLEDLDIPVQHPFAKTGLVGRIGKGKPVVALRSDIDALPVHEPEGLSFRSKNEGRMHACGHDGECYGITVPLMALAPCWVVVWCHDKQHSSSTFISTGIHLSFHSSEISSSSSSCHDHQY